jgi:hypothetical protein
MLSPSAHANLVFNGGFEEEPDDVGSGGGGVASNGTVASLTFGNISAVGSAPEYAHWDVGSPSSINYPRASNAQGPFMLGSGGPLEGSLAAVFANANQAPNWDSYISQAVQGVVESYIYHIRFALSTQGPVEVPPENFITVNWGGTFTNSSTAISGGTDLMSGPIAIPTGWKYYDFYLRAPEDNARLSFTGGADNTGILLDDVSVTFYAVPEASSLGMLMGFGLLAFGSVTRFRRRSLVTA